MYRRHGHQDNHNLHLVPLGVGENMLVAAVEASRSAKEVAGLAIKFRARISL
jgi:hypothetical protein